jgi:hypothetical protein
LIMFKLVDDRDSKVIVKELGTRRCCYITVDSVTTALQNGACTMHITVHFLTNAL